MVSCRSTLTYYSDTLCQLYTTKTVSFRRVFVFCFFPHATLSLLFYALFYSFFSSIVLLFCFIDPVLINTHHFSVRKEKKMLLFPFGFMPMILSFLKPCPCILFLLFLLSSTSTGSHIHPSPSFSSLQSLELFIPSVFLVDGVPSFLCWVAKTVSFFFFWCYSFISLCLTWSGPYWVTVVCWIYLKWMFVISLFEIDGMQALFFQVVQKCGYGFSANFGNFSSSSISFWRLLLLMDANVF